MTRSKAYRRAKRRLSLLLENRSAVWFAADLALERGDVERERVLDRVHSKLWELACWAEREERELSPFPSVGERGAW